MSIILTQLNEEQIGQIVKDSLNTILAESNLQNQNQTETKIELYTKDDIRKIFGVSLVTIHNWMKKGFLSYIKIGRRVYFKKQDINAALISINLADFNSVQSFIDKKAKK
ncbi:MAG: helix-turn-helix domain-containing protein [Desulfobulbaceae bacterium]|nr:helix-turn-helix domain-containing protein [Candidatus Kapabacteria bacterium]MBS4000586.1 helix-turn-helix domain-containing protein [Desulfobulbaceae bacterium]